MSLETTASNSETLSILDLEHTYHILKTFVTEHVDGTDNELAAAVDGAIPKVWEMEFDRAKLNRLSVIGWDKVALEYWEQYSHPEIDEGAVQPSQLRLFFGKSIGKQMYEGYGLDIIYDGLRPGDQQYGGFIFGDVEDGALMFDSPYVSRQITESDLDYFLPTLTNITSNM